MTEEPSVQRVKVSFVGAPPAQQVTRASGVSDVEIDGSVLRCLVRGSFQPFLEALRGHEVTSLESRPVCSTSGRQAPRSRARMTGVVYLLFFLTAVSGELFLRRAGISGISPGTTDATAAANDLLANKQWFWLGFALGLISIACYVAVTGLLYQLFRPVSRSVALLATLFSLVGLSVQAFAGLFQLAPLILLDGSPYLRVFDVQQLQALALMFLDLSAQAGHLYLVFDGLFLVLIGYLVFRSTFLPRILGALTALAGLGWLTLLAPPLATRLLPYLEVLGVVAEASLMLWLLVVGVNVQRWKATWETP